MSLPPLSRVRRARLLRRRAGLTLCLESVDAVKERCVGDGADYLMEVCSGLPDDRCLPTPGEVVSPGPCGEDEFHCGDGQCIQGLGVCAHRYQCQNGADELKW